MLQSNGWARRLGSEIFAPDGPTCGDKCYDYFMVNSSLAHACAGTQRITDVGVRPHRATRLLIAGSARRAMVRRMVKPNIITADLPPTAERWPPCYAGVLNVAPNAASVAEACKE